jgi:hypothetical protein
MSLVVSDTSPLTNLAAIGRLDLLQSLFGRIQIPEAVWFELNAGGRSWPGRNEVADADWIAYSAGARTSVSTSWSRTGCSAFKICFAVPPRRWKTGGRRPLG